MDKTINPQVDHTYLSSGSGKGFPTRLAKAGLTSCMLIDKEVNLSSLGNLVWSDIPVMSTLWEKMKVADNITIRVTIGKTR